MRDTQSPVGNMYFQPETSIHTYGSLPTVVLSKTYEYQYDNIITGIRLGKARRASLPAKCARAK